MPNFNSDKYLPDVIESFLAQDYTCKALLIIDGKSTDQSHKIIGDYCSAYPNIIWIKEIDSGISDAINISLGYLDDRDIWGYIGADDILLPGALSKINDLFTSIKFADGLYFDSYSYYPKKNKINLRCCPELTENNLMALGTVVGLQNFYLRAEIIKKFKFDNTLKYAMDYDLYLRLVKAKCFSFLHIPQPSTLNIQDNNISNTYTLIAEDESISSAHKIYGLNHLVFKRYVRHFFRKLFENVRRVIGLT
ncbi:glycosyltransferase [Methylophilaceae bacterium]|nr:glycosyltransferase [Methylophilaceae bacterium]